MSDMTTCEENVAAYCDRHGLFTRGCGVLVAVSGGGDSVAMLHILLRIRDRWNITIEAAHLNHALRGDESDTDEEFVRAMCMNLDVKLTAGRLGKGVVTDSNESVETAARNLRREFLDRTAADRSLDRIATGHTSDDQAETVLQRIIRGTGPSGLAGILPRSGSRIRPLLGITREEIREYLGARGIAFREDATNDDTTFFRNRLRHELIPLLADRYSVGIRNALIRLAELSRMQEVYLDAVTDDAYADAVIHDTPAQILLDRSKLLAYHAIVRNRVIRRALARIEGEGRDTDFDEVESIAALLPDDTGTLDVTGRIVFAVGGRVAVFLPKTPRPRSVAVDLPGTTMIPGGWGLLEADDGPARGYGDGRRNIAVMRDIIDRFGPLTVGPVKSGETMRPFGMEGTAKIRDIIAQTHLPVPIRTLYPVVRAGEAPIWVPGLRSAEMLRIPGGQITARNSLNIRFAGEFADTLCGNPAGADGSGVIA